MDPRLDWPLNEPGRLDTAAGRPHDAERKRRCGELRATMAQRDTKVCESECLDLGVTKAKIYRYVAPDGSLRNRGRQALAR